MVSESDGVSGNFIGLNAQLMAERRAGSASLVAIRTLNAMPRI